MTGAPSSPATEQALRLLQASSCFRGEVCASLPCACAESLAALPRSSAGSDTRLYSEEQISEAVEKVIEGMLARGEILRPNGVAQASRDDVIEECARHLESCGFRYSQGFDVPETLRRLKGAPLPSTEGVNLSGTDLLPVEEVRKIDAALSSPNRDVGTDPK